MQCGIVELELFERLAQRGVVVGGNREQAREHARLHLLEARQRCRRRVAGLGQRVADRGPVHVLDRGRDPADLAHAEAFARRALGREHAHLVDLVAAPGRHHQQLVARADFTLHDAHQRHHAQVVVEPRVDDECLQLVGRARLWRRDAGDDRFQHRLDVLPGLGADRDRLAGIDADHGLDLGLGALDVGRRQVDLVEHRHHFQALLDRRVAVGHRLRLDALRRVHHQQRALAGGQRPAHLVTEVDVAGRIDEVELVDLPVTRLVWQRHRLGLDRDATLALDRVVVEHLRFHLARGEATAQLDDAVGQRGLAVIDVGDDGKIADIGHANRRLARRQEPRQKRDYRMPPAKSAASDGDGGQHHNPPASALERRGATTSSDAGR